MTEIKCVNDVAIVFVLQSRAMVLALAPALVASTVVLDGAGESPKWVFRTLVHLLVPTARPGVACSGSTTELGGGAATATSQMPNEQCFRLNNPRISIYGPLGVYQSKEEGRRWLVMARRRRPGAARRPSHGEGVRPRKDVVQWLGKLEDALAMLLVRGIGSRCNETLAVTVAAETIGDEEEAQIRRLLWINGEIEWGEDSRCSGT